MKTNFIIPTIILGYIFLFLIFVGEVFAQEITRQEIFFSTEEDFFTQGPTPQDGNSILSDGDLLNSNGSVYMRNKELLSVFQMEFDLGLDAVEVIDREKQIVAFSTELNHPDRLFNAGDLLFTNGLIVPNQVLLYRFNTPSEIDLGLDAVYLQGDKDLILKYLEILNGIPLEVLRKSPQRLFELIKELEGRFDILFSIEGTYESSTSAMTILDGDVLSFVNGTVAIRQEDILPSAIPAGIPNRGVDFGVDALTFFWDIQEQVTRALFSTEINGRTIHFSDGDALQKGNWVIFTNNDLIGAFEPPVKNLGLDAISTPYDRTNRLIDWSEY